MRKIIFSIIFVLIPFSLILASNDDSSAETTLRHKKDKLKLQDIETCVKKYNFFDQELNEKGDFKNDFLDNGDGTITDRVTGLMWEKKGSSKKKSFSRAKKYVKSLNKKKFAGHKDWRIPTIEELYSLLEPKADKQQYIHPVFTSKASVCWSLDRSKLPTQNPVNQGRNLTIDYEKGTVSQAYTGTLMGGSSPIFAYSSFIRAVRSIE